MTDFSKCKIYGKLEEYETFHSQQSEQKVYSFDSEFLQVIGRGPVCRLGTSSGTDTPEVFVFP